MGVYGLLRFAGEIWTARNTEGKKPLIKLLGLNLALLIFFLTTVSISLLPLANWSKDTNRGVQSGENQGKGGLNRDEAMLWSMPPEELATFVIPGFFGFSRQEAGDPVLKNSSYYWGRMHFTQTNDYMGLLPWLLLPLPLVFGVTVIPGSPLQRLPEACSFQWANTVCSIISSTIIFRALTVSVCQR